MRAANAGGALLFGIWDRAAQRPMDFAAVLAAAAMSTIVVVNAAFLQTGSRSASYFAPPAPVAAPLAVAASPAQATGTATLKPAEQVIPARPVAAAQMTAQPAAAQPVAVQPVSARRDDPIANLIAPQPSPRVAAVQRALSEYGYGQIRPSGVLDEPTTSAIQKFEHEHKLPVTGRISDKLVSELTTLVGHSLN